MSALMDIVNNLGSGSGWPAVRAKLIAFDYAPPLQTASKFGDPDWWSDVEDRPFPGDDTMDELQCSGKLSPEQLDEVLAGRRSA